MTKTPEELNAAYTAAKAVWIVANDALTVAICAASKAAYDAHVAYLAAQEPKP